MICYTGRKLEKKLIAMDSINRYKKRFCYSELEKYVLGEDDYRVMSIYGLRRTGKTTMMYQMMKQLNDYDAVCLIQCSPGERMYDLTRVMDEHDGCKYYFIDEVTNLENFINTAAVLSDAYAAFGAKVVLSGTDSLGFNIAKRDQLFDRTYTLHTTYITYKEYNYLLGRSLDEYIMYGGTLTDGKTNYNHDYYNDYSNSAIVRNLTHTLSHIGRDGEYGELISIFKNNDLRTFINKILELYNRSFLAETVNKNFISHDLGSLKDLLEQKHSNIDISIFDSKVLRNQIMAELDIQEPLHSIATTKAIEEAKEWLEILDVIYRIPQTINKEYPEREKVIFTQPGLRYNQLTGLVKSLQDSSALAVLSHSQRNYICELITNDIKGRMLEDIIYYQLAKDDILAKEYEVTKFKSPYGEFDVVLINKKTDTAIAIEIKHSAAVNAKQARYLNDEKVCQKFADEYHASVKEKVVIYMGETLYETVNGVKYINAEDFLKAPKYTLSWLLLSEKHNQSIEADLEGFFSASYKKNFMVHNNSEIAAVSAAKELFLAGYDVDKIYPVLEKILPQAHKDDLYSLNIIHKAKAELRTSENVQSKELFYCRS